MGVLLCLVSAAGFGAMAIFGKLAYAQGVSPDALVVVRFTLAALLLWGLSLVQGRRTADMGSPSRREAGRRTIAIALALGAFGYATQASLYFLALDRVDASLVTLLLYTYPALVTIAAAVLGREPLTVLRLAALLVASAGTALVLYGSGVSDFDVLGLVFAFSAALTYTVYILVGDTTVKQMPPLQLTTLVMTGAAISLSLRALLTGGVDLGFPFMGWLWIGCIVVVSTVIASTAFFAGLHRTGPATASILSTFEPVTTIALAALVLGESIGRLQLAGGALVIASVLLIQFGSSPSSQSETPEPSRASTSG